MNHYLDAKHHYEALRSAMDLRALSNRFCTAFESLLAKFDNLPNLFKEFFPEKGEYIVLSGLDLRHYLLIEDCALALADYLTSLLPIREFDKAVLMEDVRQSLLPNIIESSEELKLAFYEKGAWPLRRHTPKDF